MNRQSLKFQIVSKHITKEQMENHFTKQFTRGKPIRFGFQQWAMCCGGAAIATIQSYTMERSKNIFH